MKKRTLGNIFAFVFIAAFALTFFSARSHAAAVIRKTEYSGKGKVDVDFKGKVNYKDVKVTVKDSAGKSHSASIVEKDDDDLEFRIKNYKAGESYKFTIKGIKKRSESSYGQVSGSVKIPEAKSGIPIEKIEYDASDREVTFEFDTRVDWKSARVSIKKGGKNYVKSILEKDNDEIEVKVKQLKKGTTYSYKISGIRKKGSSKYITIKGTFKA